MDMASTAHFHHQEIGSQTLESMLINPSKTVQQPAAAAEKKAKPPCEQALRCPRCDSTNTKFCYYNNYSLSQPRYFCKSCRRYWTKGGTLRNVPVGGGCRKTAKRSSSKRTQHNPNTPCSIPSYNNNNNATSPYDPAFTSDHPGFSMPGIFEAPMGFQSMYYGLGDGVSQLGLDVNGTGLGQDVGFDEMSVATTMVKHESREDYGRAGGLWGLIPWQNIGGGGGDGSWINGIGASNWQGLLNTPLM